MDPKLPRAFAKPVVGADRQRKNNLPRCRRRVPAESQAKPSVIHFTVSTTQSSVSSPNHVYQAQYPRNTKLDSRSRRRERRGLPEGLDVVGIVRNLAAVPLLRGGGTTNHGLCEWRGLCAGMGLRKKRGRLHPRNPRRGGGRRRDVYQQRAARDVWQWNP